MTDDRISRIAEIIAEVDRDIEKHKGNPNYPKYAKEEAFDRIRQVLDL